MLRPNIPDFIDNNGTITYLNAPGTLVNNGVTFANGINASGAIVGTFASAPGGTTQGYLYQNGTFTTFHDPNAGSGSGQGTFANGINSAGVIVGDYIDSANKFHGFIDVNGAFSTIDEPLGVNGTQIYGINDAGQIVGSYTDSNSLQHGFVASLNGVATLENTPLTLSNLSVSDAGAGSNPILLTLAVEHGTLTLGSTANLTVSGLGTDDVSLTGTQTAIDAALSSGLTYTPAANFEFADVLVTTANDQGHNPSGVPLISGQLVGIVVSPPANGPPVVAVPGAQTLSVGQASAISGVGLSETGNTSGETFTVTLADTHGLPVGECQRGRGRRHDHRLRDNQFDYFRLARSGERRPRHAQRHRQHGRYPTRSR